MSEHARRVVLTDPGRREITVGQLEALGLRPGRPLLVHTSLRRLGMGRDGAPALFDALAAWSARDGGGVIVPSFSWETEDPAGWIDPPLPRHELPARQAMVGPFDPASTPVHTELGFFPEYFRRQPGVTRGTHPSLAFAGIGDGAAAAVLAQPMHLPFGPESPLGWLYEQSGQVLMVATDLTTMTLLHLAETIAPRSYVRATSRRVRVVGGWAWYHGGPSCGKAFGRAAAIWGPAVAGRGRIGQAEVTAVNARELVDLALARLATGDPAWLLCDQGTCPCCDRAHSWLRAETDHIWYGDPADIPSAPRQG
ncbi:MAG: AAC(3) family N-acetyltransferase [Bacillota bacterium]|nr:AAC(3) family N-acetyltransferase [Bacillota bacterium]